jgi:CBS domain-containing protein
MATATTDMKTLVVELGDKALRAFCDDVSGMFGTEITCARQETGIVSAGDLGDQFNKLTVVHVVKAEGLLEGTIHLIFDQGGLFVLSGVVVMLPADRILAEMEAGSADEAEKHRDAAREVGNLLVGSWDRVFRKQCEAHKHFVKGQTAIGRVFEQLDGIDLSSTDEVLLVRYSMTVGSFPSFVCAVAFPVSLFGDSAEDVALPDSDKAEESKVASAPSQDASTTEEKARGSEEPHSTEAPADQKAVPPERAEDVQEKAAEGGTSARPTKLEESPTTEEGAEPAELEAAMPDDPTTTGGGLDTSGKGAAMELDEDADEPEAMFVDPRYVNAASSSPDDPVAELLQTPAVEIMCKDVVWSDPTDTVKDAISRMQRHNAGYVLIGRDGVLEGLVSGSNVAAAVSLYLRPMFAKYRRAQDDATLGVKLKWVMSQPVRTIGPDTTMGTIIENMCRYGGRCLPVVGDQGEVQGIVTTMDLLMRILKTDRSFTWQGRPLRALPLLI